jgi:hypothetical protein
LCRNSYGAACPRVTRRASLAARRTNQVQDTPPAAPPHRREERQVCLAVRGDRTCDRTSNGIVWPLNVVCPLAWCGAANGFDVCASMHLSALYRVTKVATDCNGCARCTVLCEFLKSVPSRCVAPLSASTGAQPLSRLVLTCPQMQPLLPSIAHFLYTS